MTPAYNKTVKKIFMNKLEEYARVAAQQLYERYKFQCTAVAKQFPLLMAGMWQDSENLKPTDSVEPVLKHGTLSIGFIGLAECLIALTGKHHGESEKSQELGIEIITRLKELCDIVIIDGTPCELVTDSIILSRIVDSTVIVTAHKQTKKDDLKKIVTNIQNVGGKIAGIVLNKVPVSAKRYEQAYYYGSTKPTNINTRNRKVRTSPMNMNSGVRQNKVDQMKRRVRPENPQATRNVREQQRKSEDQKPKALQNKMNIEKSEGVSLEKTTDILNQINEYLDKEKKNLNNQ